MRHGIGLHRHRPGRLRVEAVLSCQQIQTVLHHVGRRGIPSGSLPEVALPAQQLPGAGDEVIVPRHRRLRLALRHQRRLHIGGHARLRPLGAGQQLAGEAMSPEVRHIRPGDGADAEGRDVLLPQQRIKGDVGGDGQLPADVVAVNVGAGIRLGIAQLLRPLQHSGKICSLSGHGIHDEVGGAVHDASHLRHGVHPAAALQIYQPWDTSAHRRRTAKRHPVFTSQRRQLPVVGADDCLIGRHHVLPPRQRPADPFIGRVQTPQHLHHRVDIRIPEDGLHVLHRRLDQRRHLPAHQHLLHIQGPVFLRQLPHAAAYHAEAQQSDVHSVSSFFSMMCTFR